MFVARRIYAFHASEPDSRPPPVSFSPPIEPDKLGGWQKAFRTQWPKLIGDQRLALWGDVEADPLSEWQI